MNFVFHSRVGGACAAGILTVRALVFPSAGRGGRYP